MGKGERTRERILGVALEEFADKGPAGARINDIAERAEINKERIYAYFRSKDGLFTAVLHRTFERLHERDLALETLDEADLPELPAILLRHFMRSHQQDPSLWRIIAWENLGGGVHLEAIEPLTARGYDRIAELYRVGQERGLFPATAGYPTFITMLIGIAYFHHSNRLTMERSLGRRLDTKAAQDRFIREAAAFFVAS